MTYFASGFDEEEEKNIRLITTGIGSNYDSGTALAYRQSPLCL